MKRARQRPPQGEPRPGPKHRQIIEAARAVFTEQGFDAARVDDVARRARVGKGTVYNHFDSKEALLVECVLDSVEETRERIDSLLKVESRPKTALASLLRALILEVLPRLIGGPQSLTYQVWTLVARDPSARERLFESYRSIYAEREERLRRGLELGSASGEFRADLPASDVSLILLAVFDGLVYRAMFDPDRIEPQAALDALLRLLETGLQARPGTLATDEGAARA